MKKNGIYLSTNASTEKNIYDLNYHKEHIESGELKPVIDKRYPLDQALWAIKLVNKGYKKGNIVNIIT